MQKLFTIYLSIVSDALLPLEASPQQNSLHLSLPRYSFFACSSSPPLPVPLSLMYSFTLSVHLPSGLPLLFRPSGLNHIHFFPQTLHPLSLGKACQHIPFHSDHSILHSICTSFHVVSLIHVFIALTVPFCHSTCPSQITHFCSMHC